MNRTKVIRVSSAWSLDPSLYTESESPQVGGADSTADPSPGRIQTPTRAQSLVSELSMGWLGRVGSGFFSFW